MELSESPAAPANDANTRSGGPSVTFDVPRGIPGLVEHLGRGPVAQGLMRSLVVVEPEVGAQFPPSFTGVGANFQPTRFSLGCNESDVQRRPTSVFSMKLS